MPTFLQLRIFSITIYSKDLVVIFAHGCRERALAGWSWNREGWDNENTPNRTSWLENLEENLNIFFFESVLSGCAETLTRCGARDTSRAQNATAAVRESGARRQMVSTWAFVRLGR